MLVWYIRAMIRHDVSVRRTWPGSEKCAQPDSVPSLTLNPCMPWPPTCPGPNVPLSVERAIAVRWKQWVPWVLMQQRRAPNYRASIATAEMDRLRQRHREHILDLMREGVSMRTIRRHRLDDPRLSDELRTVLVEAARDRQSKAWFRRPAELRAEEKLATLINLGPVERRAQATDPNDESHQAFAQAAEVVPDPPSLREAIQAIRRLVCEHFYLREMRDPELTVRTNRRAYVLPRQLAMYIARQLTGVSLQEIGREFGRRHHTTVLHAVNRIEAMRRCDEALNRTILQLMDALAAQI